MYKTRERLVRMLLLWYRTKVKKGRRKRDEKCEGYSVAEIARNAIEPAERSAIRLTIYRGKKFLLLTRRYLTREILEFCYKRVISLLIYSWQFFDMQTYANYSSRFSCQCVCKKQKKSFVELDCFYKYVHVFLSPINSNKYEIWTPVYFLNHNWIESFFFSFFYNWKLQSTCDKYFWIQS